MPVFPIDYYQEEWMRCSARTDDWAFSGIARFLNIHGYLIISLLASHPALILEPQATSLLYPQCCCFSCNFACHSIASKRWFSVRCAMLFSRENIYQLRNARGAPPLVRCGVDAVSGRRAGAAIPVPCIAGLGTCCHAMGIESNRYCRCRCIGPSQDGPAFGDSVYIIDSVR